MSERDKYQMMLFNYAVETSKLALNWTYFCKIQYITRKHNKSKLTDNDEHLNLPRCFASKKEDSLGFIVKDLSDQ